jgi:hypothetical protein
MLGCSKTKTKNKKGKRPDIECFIIWKSQWYFIDPNNSKYLKQMFSPKPCVLPKDSQEYFCTQTAPLVSPLDWRCGRIFQVFCRCWLTFLGCCCLTSPNRLICSGGGHPLPLFCCWQIRSSIPDRFPLWAPLPLPRPSPRPTSVSPGRLAFQSSSPILRNIGSSSGPMAQDDPVVSAQWLEQHLGQPDIKVKNLNPWSTHFHLQFLKGYLPIFYKKLYLW